METAEMKKITDDLNRTFEAFKERGDKMYKEMETRNGEVTEETRAALERTNDELTSLREALKGLETRLNRPGIDTEGEDQTEEKKLESRAFNKFLRHGVDNDVSHGCS